MAGVEDGIQQQTLKIQNHFVEDAKDGELRIKHR